MIKLIKLENSEPYKQFHDLYNKAIEANQRNTEAICISSYNQDLKEISSRFVNLKYIRNNQWFFYTNYDSPKSIDFEKHEQISCAIFWNKINVQIRFSAIIKKIDIEESNKYFLDRSLNKNALAVSSMQSQPISSYEMVKANYKNTLDDLKDSIQLIRPDYWGGYCMIPYYFEFWEGHENRLNKRLSFSKKDSEWNSIILQP